MLAGTQVPVNWAECNGQLLPIHKWQALYSLLGTRYGGNGQTQFALPDFRGLLPLGQGQGSGLSSYAVGQQGGSDQVDLSENELPAHSHSMQVSNNEADAAGNGPVPTDQLLARGGYDDGISAGAIAFYSPSIEPLVEMNAQQASITGGSMGHNNRSPFLTVMFIIALQGVYPPPP
jgi:microcystin-dependent protein